MILGFFGAGKMATAIATGLIEQNILSPNDIVAVDIVPDARETFGMKTGVRVLTEPRELVTEADAVILAIKPQDAAHALPDLQDSFAGKLLISIAAGLSIDKLSSWIGHQRIIRVMPNTPAMVNRGASAYACGKQVTDQDRQLAHSIFQAIGIAHELDEAQLDAVTGLSGSGPAYVFEFIQALVDGAVKQGLPADVALELTIQTVAGAADMLAQGKGTPDQLRDAVTSKGGTTAAGLQVLHESDFRQLISRTVQRATERSIELGKGG